jgi:Flp pilus assembly protein TadD
MNNVGSEVRWLCAAALLLTMAACAAKPPSGGDLQQAPPAPALAAWAPSLHLADAALLGGAPTIALRISDELLAKNPRNVSALVRRSSALIALGRAGEAATSLSKAIEIDPKDTKTLIGLGRLRIVQDPAAAEALFARAIILDPQDAIGLSNLGVARDLQGRHAAAQEAYRMALGVDPTSVPAQVNLGLSMALSGDPSAAVRLLQPLAAAPDAAPRIRQNLALALALSGRRNEASAVLGHDLPSDQVRSALDGFAALQP